ncbi:MAG: argininosuccinate synthase, partial [Ignavibacteriaceae bacterium]|nr:argininosuccinate synthase [Ignavibacteriaceae bacterium]
YNGLWCSPLREALHAFIDKTHENVTGLVKLKLYKGDIIVSGRTSPFSLYDPLLATYTIADQFDHSASEGFIKIYGLPYKTINRVAQKAEDEKKGVLV